MTYKTILAHLDGSDSGRGVLALAGRLAHRFDAHLVAVYGADWPVFAAAAMDPSAGEMLRYQVETDQLMLKQARAQVTEAETVTGLAIEWRAIAADLIFNLTMHARHADLLVMAQDNPDRVTSPGPMRVSSMALSAGRPVLAVPYAGQYADCGQSVLLAWNGSREAARAAADALPLLKAARRVVVAAFDADTGIDAGDIACADIAQWLARHGVKVTVDRRPAADGAVGELLLSMAADLGSDLIVMGAYGHSRIREFVLGGVTRTLLTSMTAPVLLAH